jgi:hypothetical protein
MTIANVTLNNTFDEWRTVTNQVITFVNEVDSQQLINAASNTAVLTVTPNKVARNQTLYISLNVSSDVLDVSTLNVATANAVNIVFAALANTDARLVLVSNDANTINAVTNAAIIQANVARVHANTAHASANAGLLQANTARVHANVSFEQANTARIHSNTAHASANAGLLQANTARDHANVSFEQANTSRNQANTAHASANAGLLQANTARNQANVSFEQANTSRNQANVSFEQANTSRIHSNAAHASANAGLLQANTARDHANVSFEQANTARNQANTAHASANAGLLQANTARVHANVSFEQANTARVHANAAFEKGNSAYEIAVALSGNTAPTLQANKAAFDNSNSAFDQANTARVHANTAHVSANAGLLQANTARDHANVAFLQANTARVHANAGLLQANTARDHANNSFEKANSALPNTTATLAGSLTTTGSIVANSTVTITPQNSTNEGGELRINGAANNDDWTIDSVNQSMRIFTGSSNTNLFQIFNAGSGIINMSVQGHASIASMNVVPTIQASFDQANTARVHANTAHASANAGLLQANTARDHANVSFEQANTARNQANASYAFANSSHLVANLAFIHANNAFDKANAALSNTSGSSFVGNLQIPTGNLTIGDGITQGTRLFVNAYIGVANVIPIITAKNGSQFINLNANTNFGGWNDLMLDRDLSIIYSKGTSDDKANLVIGPWTDSSFGYKQDGAGRHGFNTSNPRYVVDANGSANISGTLIVSGTNLIDYLSATGAGANVYTRTVGDAGNSYMLTTGASVGAGANVYTRTVGTAGNNYTREVGTAGNNYTREVGTAGNNFMTTTGASIGAGANAFATSIGIGIGTGANNFSSSATNLTTGTVPSARLSGSYTGITGVGTITTGVWNGTDIAVTAGGTGASDSGTARTNLGLGTMATQASSSVSISGGSISGLTSLDVSGAIGVGTAAPATAGEIRATNNITAYYSDKRLKTNIKQIENALDKVNRISGVTFTSNEEAAKYGYTDTKTQVGVIAQEVEEVLPEVVVPAPFDIGKNEDGTEYSKSGENYKTVKYEKIVPLLIEAIKELTAKVEMLESKAGK